MAKRQPTPIKPPHPTEFPEWLLDVPEETDYRISVFISGGENIEDVHLDREEYLALKMHLAVMRGIKVPATRPHVKSGYADDIWDALEPEDILELQGEPARKPRLAARGGR